MKKFIISSDSLKPALKKLAQAVSSKPQMPILSNVWCKAGKGEVELITSDIELTISVTCEAQVEDGPFELLLPFEFLHDIVSLAKSAPIAIEHPSTRKARINDGKDWYEQSGLAKLEELPKFPAVPKKNVLKVDDSFVDLLGKCMLTISKQEVHPALTKACLDIQEEQAILVSTDTQVMYKHNIGPGSKEKVMLLLSPKLAKALEASSEMEVSWTDKHVAFKTPSTTVISKRFEDKYPAYNSVIPTYEPNLQVNREELVNALKKCCIGKDAAVRTKILLKDKPGEIKFEVEDADFGRNIHPSIAGDYTGPVSVIALNAKKLLTIMDQVTSETIRLHIQEPEKAILVSAEENSNYLGLIMPIKL